MEKELFNELISSVREAGRISRGESKAKRVHGSGKLRAHLKKTFKPAQIVRMRTRLKMSQAELAQLMLISKATLQSWEQGRRKPEGPALALIRVMDKNPEAVATALHA